MDKIMELIKTKIEDKIDAKVSILKLNNNSSIIIHSKNNSHSLILSMEKYLKAYKRGEDIENITKKIVEIYDEENKTINKKNNDIKEDIDIDNGEKRIVKDINDPMIKETFKKEYLLNNIFLGVMSLNKNIDYLKDKFFIDILNDIAAVLTVPIKDSIDIFTTLTKYTIQTLDIEIDELIKSAVINTINRVNLYKLEDLEMKILGMDVDPVKVDDEFEFEDEELYTICSDNNLFASGILICKEYLDNLCLNAPNGIGIIPSSTHELIIFKMDDNVDIEYTKSMIYQVNNDPNCINNNTFLSNNLFHYTPEDSLKIIE